MNALLKRILKVLMDYLFPIIIEAVEEWLNKKIDELQIGRDKTGEDQN